MRIAGTLLIGLLLAGCSSEPAPAPSLGSATQSAAAHSEFTLVPAAQREAFPDWSGDDIDGYAWTTANLGQRVTVVNFWASWCQPCVDEWPELQAAAAGHPSVAFVGVNSMDERAAARGFVHNHPSEYRHLFDAKADLLRGLESVPAHMLPTTLILDREHRVAAWKVGPVLRGQVRRALAALLRTG